MPNTIIQQVSGEDLEPVAKRVVDILRGVHVADVEVRLLNGATRRFVSNELLDDQDNELSYSPAMDYVTSKLEELQNS